MKYICSATLKHLPAQPEDWLGFMACVAQINAEQIEYFQQVAPQASAWHSFKIRNYPLAKKPIAYLFKITQCLEVFSTLLPAVALEQHSSEKAKKALRALKGIEEKITDTKSSSDAQ